MSATSPETLELRTALNEFLARYNTADGYVRLIDGLAKIRAAYKDALDKQHKNVWTKELPKALLAADAKCSLKMRQKVMDDVRRYAGCRAIGEYMDGENIFEEPTIQDVPSEPRKYWFTAPKYPQTAWQSFFILMDERPDIPETDPARRESKEIQIVKRMARDIAASGFVDRQQFCFSELI